MKVLITGGAGYIGSQITHLLNDLGNNIEVIDNLSTGSKKLLPKNITLHRVDIGEEIKVFKILKNFEPDIVIHLAAYIEVEESIINPLKYYENNVLKTISFLNSCIKSKTYNLIFSSTAAVYGSSSNHLINEKTETNPESPYGNSKLIVEKIIQDLSNNTPLRCVIFRYFNVAGADRMQRTGQIKEPASHLIKVACETALGKRDKIEIFGNDYDTKDGTCVRDFIHILDLAELHLKAIEYLLKGGSSIILNCGYGKGFSVLDVIKEVKSISKQDFQVEFTQRRKGDPSQLIADGSYSKKILKWKPKNDTLKSIINDAYEWEKCSKKNLIQS